MKTKPHRSQIWLFKFVVFFLLFYLSYRYPMQINSSTTSPTYSDTPFILSFLKYLTIISLLAFGVVFLRRNTLGRATVWSFRVNAITRIYFFISAWLTVLGMASNDFYYFEFGFSFFAAATLWNFSGNWEDIPKELNKVFFVFLYACLAFQIFQYWNFFYFERLPALAYYDSISVRFGGVWDDPNGFALWLSFLIPFAFISIRNKFFRISVLFTLLIFLISTQSLTGIFSFLGASSIIFIFSRRNIYNAFFKGVIILTLSCLTVVLILGIFDDFFKLFWELKSGSVDGHAESFDLTKFGIWQFLGLSGDGMLGESGYVNIFYSSGALFSILLFSLIGFVFYLILVSLPFIKIYCRSSLPYIFFWISVSIAMINLPVETIFPINILYFLFTLYVYKVCRQSIAASNSIRQAWT